MEDFFETFETLVGIIVIVVAICARASKNKKKNRRPGQKPQPEEKKATTSAAKRTAEPKRRGKALRVPVEMTPENAMPKNATPKGMTPEHMVPEQLQPEDMTPEALTPEPMQATLAEGESHGDGAGCIGGSLEHDASVHQGTEFHAAGTHGTRRVRPAAAETPTTLSTPRISVAQLRNAVIWSEILDKPVSMREQ